MKRISLIGLPLLVGFLAIKLKIATGPYWLGVNNDPSYIYLVNSLYLVDHITPIFVDHPGITLQLLGAWIIQFLNFNQPIQEILKYVYLDPEYYLNTIHAVLLILYLGSLTWMGWVAFHKTRDILFALLIQTPSFLYLTLKSYGHSEGVLPIIANINAEPLLITILNVFVLCLLKLFFDIKEKQCLATTLLLGVVCGLGVATKVSFIPLMLIPVFLLPQMKSRILFVLTFFLSWFLITIPLIPRYGKMFQWWKGIVVHTGFHGSGKVGFLDLSEFWVNLKWVVQDNVFLFLVIILGLLGILIKIFQLIRLKENVREEDKNILKFLLVLSLVSLLQFFVVAKQPAPQYLVPAVGLFGLIAAFQYRLLGIPKRIKDRYVSCLLLLFVIVNVINAIQYQRKLYSTNQEIYEFAKRVYTKYQDCLICGYYRSSSVEFALEFGDDCYGYKAHAKVLKDLYPSAYFFHYWTRVFHDFTNDIPLKVLMARNSCVLIYGMHYAHDFRDGFLKLEKIETSESEDVFRVTGSTAEEAVSHYLTAKYFQTQRQYRQAYLHALRAKELGFPRLENYLEELKKLIQNK